MPYQKNTPKIQSDDNQTTEMKEEGIHLPLIQWWKIHGIGQPMWWSAWLPVMLIGVFHYSSGHELAWAHDILRRLYYIPILFAASSQGIRGGLLIALASSITYIPHAFLLEAHNNDPSGTLNKVLEVLLYNIIGMVAGTLSDKEMQRRKQVEQALNETKKMQVRLVRTGRLAALGELVAGVAHEIKNPLHIIKGSAEVVDDLIPKNIEGAQMWQLLKQEVKRLELIAERFLSFARPSQALLITQPLSVVFDRISELLEAQGRTAKTHLVITPLAEHLKYIPIEVDRDQIAQIILNLGSNALRAAGHTGEILLFASLTKEHIVIALQNNGPCINDNDLERIFDPFVTQHEGGTGLGLSISSQLAAANNGFLRAQNLPYDQTTKSDTTGVIFELLLPFK